MTGNSEDKPIYMFLKFSNLPLKSVFNIWQSDYYSSSGNLITVHPNGSFINSTLTTITNGFICSRTSNPQPSKATLGKYIKYFNGQNI